MSTENLSDAKKNKNNEFYTIKEDIESELKFYKKFFKNKVVYCNCDNPEKSEFWKFFVKVFKDWEIKKLIATYYNPNKENYVYELAAESECNPRIIKRLIDGDGDFRSDMCINLLKKADIVVTNPPFSLFREYISQLIEYDKKFLIIGSKNALTYKDVFRLIKENKIWLGCTSPKTFKQPDGTLKKFGNIGWFTNLDIDKRYEKIDLSENYYDVNKYAKYDNYNAINVNKVSDIPCDYYGVMGVPITFLDKYNPEQFEILGITSGRKEFDKRAYPIKHYENAKQHCKDGSIVNGSKVNTRANIIVDNPCGIYYTADNSNGKLESVYARILIQRKV